MSSHLSPYYGTEDPHSKGGILAPSSTPTHKGDNTQVAGARSTNISGKQEPSAAYLKDLNLVAEAAKRAQAQAQGSLLRDLEHCKV